MAWVDEGIECYVSKGRRAGLVPLYHVWDGGHDFYISEREEYMRLPRESRKGITCWIAPPRTKGHVPLYHLHNPKTKDHLYCSDVDEKREAVTERGYKRKRIAGFVLSHRDSTHWPLFRAFNPETKGHFYTKNVREIEARGPKISKYRLRRFLIKELQPYFRKTRTIHLGDDEYFCTSEKVVRTTVRESRVEKRTHVPGASDCDDFAHMLKSAFIDDACYQQERTVPHAFGILFGKNPHHAVNFAVVSNGKPDEFDLWIIDSFEGKMYKPSAGNLEEIYLAVC